MLDFVLFTQTLVVAVFGWAVIGKVFRHGAFAAFVATIRAMGVGASLAKPIAAGVALAEVGVVATTLIPVTRPAGFGAASALLAGFAVVAVVAARRRLTVPCQCFGSGGRPLGYGHALRNASAAALAAAGAWAAVILRNAGHFGPVDAVAVIAGGLVCAVLFITVDKLVEAMSAVTADPRSRKG